jgi:hypothetical protein
MGSSVPLYQRANGPTEPSSTTIVSTTPACSQAAPVVSTLTPAPAAEHAFEKVCPLQPHTGSNTAGQTCGIVIFDEINDRFREVRDAMEPEFEAIRSERADRVMGLLTSEQKLEYQVMLNERQRARDEKSGAHSEQKK